ncbi:unnamed protein product [Spirodela intermedia]|uniref:Peptidase A1 domain-containing protein n=1 Tax=Spirodela intermedia TaxID=51605 RepID=A0A7I8IE02_SPIIN|nr:unnamed protein product [Spirodela intermedia]CAA6656018.1 unnamed protein product [Spirodela intermedia]
MVTAPLSLSPSSCFQAWPPTGHLAAALGFDFHHRFSNRVRQWVESGNWVGGKHGPRSWPEMESVELTGADSPLTFSDGNETFRLSTLGFLYYAEVSVGTPGVSFLVALDTGSDLFWLPCDCKSCAPTSSQSYGLGRNSNFSIYSPRNSSTSKRLPCRSSFCSTSVCPYSITYVTANTSTSGILVQDVLHLITDDYCRNAVQARIILGCGQTQTGAFLKYAAPNGLFGLGLKANSVPSILSRAGITSDSFSMCFGKNGVGRIRFGDKGSSDQLQTPFITHRSRAKPRYDVNVTSIRVETSSAPGSFIALVDSGTSFTSLADPAYTILAESFNSMVQDQRGAPAPNFSFEYCYELRSNESTVPTIGLIMEGGSEFPVAQPTILVSSSLRRYFCLGIIKSTGINIIGQNFMEGLRIVFDREKLVLGWKESSCRKVGEASALWLHLPRPSRSLPRHPSSACSSSTTRRGSGRR